MDPSVQRALNDKLYDKRKQGALEYDFPVPTTRARLIVPPSLERIIREASANRDYDKISKIVNQLCHDFAYAVHQPHARNGGLIGLAAASIALGSVRTDEYYVDNISLTSNIGGGRAISEGDRSAGSSMLYGSRCKGSILRMRKHVQYCKGCERGNSTVLQRRLRFFVQGTAKILRL